MFSYIYIPQYLSKKLILTFFNYNKKSGNNPHICHQYKGKIKCSIHDGISHLTVKIKGQLHRAAVGESQGRAVK